jgi:hypothetical protein
MKSASFGAIACLCLPSWAQTPAPPQPLATPVVLASPSARADANAEAEAVQRAAQSTPQGAAAGTSASRTPEPKVQRTRSEDDGVRIDELRVRGLNRKVVVQSKVAGAPAYEIGTDDDARDLSQDRRNEGRSFWRLFSF